MNSLERFVLAQNEVFDQARLELLNGEKRSHWMWFIFPQLAGLGSSPMARRFAIPGLDEARQYLGHTLLGPRLAEATQLMLGWAGRRSASAILGQIDAIKFCSSMTLFEAASTANEDSERFSHALEAFCQGSPDPLTMRLLNAPPSSED